MNGDPFGGELRGASDAFGAISPCRFDESSRCWPAIPPHLESPTSAEEIWALDKLRSSCCSEGNAKSLAMMCGFLTRVSVMIFGYAYPAYECYKTVELNKPEIEQLLFWCQYWILVALLAVFERFGDALISWLPLYGEIKLAFFIYLWHPKTKGTTYIYSNFLQPYMSKHESKIDRKLLELRTRAADLASCYWQKALRNGRSWFFESLQHIALQPSTVVHPVEEPAAHARHSSAAPPHKTEQTSTSPQAKAEQPNLAVNQKPEHAKAENSPPPPPSSPTTKPSGGHGGHSRTSATSSSHHPSSPHNEMPAQHNLTGAKNPNPSPHPEDPKLEEEPARMFRRPRTKKRVTATASSIP